LNADIFASWLRIQGHRVVHTTSTYWYEAGSHVYQAFPYHWIIQPSEEELTDFLKQHRAIALRYSAPVEVPFGFISYHAVYEEPSYEMEYLDRRSRQNVRKGLANCQIEQISLERMAEEGWDLEMDTASRQGRRPSMTKEVWRQRYLAAGELPGFEAWAALVDGQLAATLLSFQMEDCCELISQQCHRDYLRARINNALTFRVTQTMINRPTIRSIFYTLQSLDAPSSVDDFKFRMGFTAKPVRQRVLFHPWLALFANRVTHGGVARLLRWDSGSTTLAKAEGMLRFYLEGRRTIDQQEWPECLANRKAEILGSENSE
jgi:hypothetical protein